MTSQAVETGLVLVLGPAAVAAIVGGAIALVRELRKPKPGASARDSSHVRGPGADERLP